MNHAWATKNVLLACVFYRALNHHNREHIETIFKLRAKHLLVAALKKFFYERTPQNTLVGGCCTCRATKNVFSLESVSCPCAHGVLETQRTNVRLL